MCIAYLTKENPNYPLIIAANRDEFYHRPFLPTQKNDQHYYPIDLESQGTWIGFNTKGNFALVTNIRRKEQIPNKKSRGILVPEFLKSNSYQPTEDINYYNFVYGNLDETFVASKLPGQIQQIKAPKTFSLSNSFDNHQNWEKVQRLSHQLDFLKVSSSIDIDKVFEVLNSKEQSDFSAAQETGFPDPIEQSLNSIFIQNEKESYGTVHQFLLTIHKNGNVIYYERYLKEQTWTEIEEHQVR
jgi:uncharacterized protein with NRDE domain